MIEGKVPIEYQLD
jgi:hypothetical protein